MTRTFHSEGEPQVRLLNLIKHQPLAHVLPKDSTYPVLAPGPTSRYVFKLLTCSLRGERKQTPRGGSNSARQQFACCLLVIFVSLSAAHPVHSLSPRFCLPVTGFTIPGPRSFAKVAVLRLSTTLLYLPFSSAK